MLEAEFWSVPQQQSSQRSGLTSALRGGNDVLKIRVHAASSCPSVAT